MNRSEYLNELKEKQKELLLKIVEVFDTFDGDLTNIGNAINKSKQTISRILNSELFEEMIKDGQISQEMAFKIKIKLIENKRKGNKKGGENFKNKYDVEFNDSHRITGHIKK